MPDEHDEIAGLAVAYAWAIDTKQLDELRSVFTPDATADLGGISCAGVDDIIERVGRAVGRLDVTQHLLGNHQVHVDGDTATHRCQLQAQHVRRDTPGGDQYIVAGVYDDHLARTAEGWRIAHRTLTVVWTAGNPAVVGRDFEG